MSIPPLPSSTYTFQLDPELVAQAQAYGSADVQIDPALFELAKVVDDAQRGRLRFDIDEEEEQIEQDAQVHVELEDGVSGQDHEQGEPMEDDIDPALREIVNSLTAAQQAPRTATPGMTQAEAAVAINALLGETHDATRTQGAFEDITQATFGSLFPNGFPRQSDADNFLLPDPQAESSTTSHINDHPIDSLNTSSQPQPSNHHATTLSSRGRGRPRGSKNRPKPPHLLKPKPPKPPPRKRGRPVKIRTAEELAAIEKKRSDRELGLSRGKGRPRKFERYLVREMRLKRNRAEYLALIRGWEEGGRVGEKPDEEPDQRDMEGEGDGGDKEEVEEEQDMDPVTLRQFRVLREAYDVWGNEEESLIEAVRNLKEGNADSSDIGNGLGPTRHEDADMNDVFGLPAE